MGRNLETQIHGFGRGMDRDTSPDLLPDGTWVDARNMLAAPAEEFEADFGAAHAPRGRAATGSTGRLVTMRGDSQFVLLPVVPPRKTVTLTFTPTAQQWAADVSVALVDRDGAPVAIPTVQITAAGGIFRLAAELTEAAQGHVMAYVEGGAVKVVARQWAATFGVTCLPVAGVACGVTEDVTPAQGSQVVLGHAFGGGRLALVTTWHLNDTPADPAGNVGQVWWIPIPADGPPLPIVSGTPSAAQNGLDDVLRYSGPMNVSKAHEMECVLTLENDCVTRLTFTDGLNPVRSVNLRDADLRFNSAEALQLLPAYALAPPAFAGMGEGSLRSGMYWYFYRLIGTGGQVTAWSTPGNGVMVTQAFQTASSEHPYRFLRAFHPNAPTPYKMGDPAGRSVLLDVPLPEGVWRMLEVAAVYASTAGGPEEAVLVVRQALPFAQPSLSVVHVDMEQRHADVSVEEFRVAPLVVGRVKSIAEADQRLVLANWCPPDALAYSQRVGGGAGQITTEFVMHDMRSDDRFHSTAPHQLNWNKGHDLMMPSGGQPHDHSGSPPVMPYARQRGDDQFMDHKGPFAAHYFKGYRNQEVYAFGIVFHLREGGSSQVHWIGNVTMPTPFGGSPNLPSLGFPNPPYYPLRTNILSAPAFVQAQTRSLGVRFSGIHLPEAVRRRVIGFSVVRSAGFGRAIATGMLTMRRYLQHARAYFLAPDYDFGTTAPTVQEGDYLSATVEMRPLYHGHTVFTHTKLYGWYPLLDSPAAGGGVPDARALDLDGFQFVRLDTSTALYPLNLMRRLDLPPSVLAVHWVQQPLTMPRVFFATHIRPSARVPETLRQLEGVEWHYTGHYQAVAVDGPADYDAVVFGGDVFADIYTRVGRGSSSQMYHVFPWSEQHPSLSSTAVWLFAYFPTLSRAHTPTRAVGAGAGGGQMMMLEEQDAENVPYATATEDFGQGEAFAAGADVQTLAGVHDPADACAMCAPTGMLVSQRKIYGERLNAFGRLLHGSMRNLDFRHGPIVRIAPLEMGGRGVLAFQATAVSWTPVSRPTLSVAAGAGGFEAVLGTGEELGQARYLTEHWGCQHQWSVARLHDAYYWVDAMKREALRLAGNRITPMGMRGLRGFLASWLESVADRDGPLSVGGIVTGVDERNGNVLFTAVRRPHSAEPSDTVLWSEALGEDGAWLSFYDVAPPRYVNVSGNRLLSPRPFSRLMEHWASGNHCYFHVSSIVDPMDPVPKTDTPGYVTFVVNKHPLRLKRLAHFVVEAHRMWDRVELYVDRVHGAATSPALPEWGPVAYRGSAGADLWQPRGRRWQGPAPMLTDVRVGDGPWEAGQALEFPVGEVILVRLLAQRLTRTDLMAVVSYIAAATPNH